MFSCRPLQEAACLGWVWTIVTPGEQEDTDYWAVLPLQTDLDIWELHKEGGCVAVDKDPRLLTADELPPSASAALQSAETTVFAELPWRHRRGWKTATINRALARWTRTHTGRSDVRFRWDGNIIDTASMQALEHYRSEESAAYVISESASGHDIAVTDTVMDQLLEMDPELAAELSAAIAEIDVRRSDPRDPARIQTMLDEIAAVWRRRPDLRLMQLLGSCWPVGHDPYYVEDDTLLSLLHSRYDEDRGV